MEPVFLRPVVSKNLIFFSSHELRRIVCKKFRKSKRNTFFRETCILPEVFFFVENLFDSVRKNIGSYNSF